VDVSCLWAWRVEEEGHWDRKVAAGEGQWGAGARACLAEMGGGNLSWTVACWHLILQLYWNN